jgi:hypothetical protein
VRDEEGRPAVEEDDDGGAEGVHVEDSLRGPRRSAVEGALPLDGSTSLAADDLLVVHVHEVDAVHAPGDGDHPERSAFTVAFAS